LYRDAVRVPITLQIVNQIRGDHKERLFEEIRYYTSVNIALMRDRAGESSLDLETQALRETTGSQANGEISVLTFREGGSSLDQSRISRDDEGQLVRINPAGDTFEIEYPNHQIVLGFVLNREENWYDLEFAIEEADQERVSLALTGARPHLMINYRAVFPDTDETRIQLTGKPGRETEDTGESARQSGQQTESSGDPGQSRADPGESYEQAQGFPWESEPGYFPQGETSRPLDPEAGGTVRAPDARDPAGEWGGGLSWEDSTADEPLYPDTVTDTAAGGSTPSPLGGAPVPSRERVLVEYGEDAYEPEVVFAGAADTNNDRLPGICYSVQVGAFRDKKNADAACAVLERGGFAPLRETYQGLTRVVVPVVEQRDLARTRERIRSMGFGEPYVR
jgi:hypothetical protein